MFVTPKPKLFFCLVLSLVLAMFLGCSGVPDIVSREKKPGEKYSADEMRRVTIDQPFLLSGDHFRERDPDTYVGIGEIFGDGKSDTKKAVVKSPAKSMTVVEKAETKDYLAAKIGVVFDKSVEPEHQAIIQQAAAKAIKGFPFVLANRRDVRETVLNSGCQSEKRYQCVSKKLAVYPGLRLVAVIEKLILPDKFPETLELHVVPMDTGIGFQYRPMIFSSILKSRSDIDKGLMEALRRVFDFFQETSRIMPWSCRSFSKQGDQWYINAGKRSGLKPGDRLRVMSPGKTVINPNGLPAGWIPGDEKGHLKVMLLFGDDFAACALIRGKEPNPDDLLVIAGTDG